MNTNDWKAQLLGATGFSDEELRQASEENQAKEGIESDKKNNHKEKLSIFVEKKGRAGKTATIITGFKCSDADLRDIASGLKNSLGCGGSYRDGEILIQGSRREEAAAYLRKSGYKIG